MNTEAFQLFSLWPAQSVPLLHVLSATHKTYSLQYLTSSHHGQTYGAPVMRSQPPRHQTLSGAWNLYLDYMTIRPPKHTIDSFIVFFLQFIKFFVLYDIFVSTSTTKEGSATLETLPMVKFHLQKVVWTLSFTITSEFMNTVTSGISIWWSCRVRGWYARGWKQNLQCGPTWLTELHSMASDLTTAWLPAAGSQLCFLSEASFMWSLPGGLPALRVVLTQGLKGSRETSTS